MDDWMIEDDPSRGWLLRRPDAGSMPIGPKYRGSFEEGDSAPGRICVAAEARDRGASARFVSPRTFPFFRRRAFGVSVEIPPEEWTPMGTRKGWHFFRRESAALGLWSSLPATWLAQDGAGNPLEPPWRELWTFGADHTWICRLGMIGGATGGFELFAAGCLAAGDS